MFFGCGGFITGRNAEITSYLSCQIEHILSESKATGEPEGIIATRFAESIIYR